MLDIVRTVATLRDQVDEWRRAGQRIALVPTMGALHAGHLSLVHQGRETCDRVVATIFVNPAQFGPSEDFATYPRGEADDVTKLEAAGVDLLFAPDVGEMYPENFATNVTVSGITDCLCGLSRPGFFDGVATVVSKLLLQALPDVAVFGDKDYQQLLVIRRVVRDLNIPVDIIGAPTVREQDGLALSSRNAYLGTAERQQAAALFRSLGTAAENIETGRGEPEAETAAALQRLTESGFTKIDYFELRDAETLAPAVNLQRPSRLFAAAWLGATRLIDNVSVAARAIPN
ncbi:MAG: pantoate--beta-alanine ligase [Alphaproteobacteria bacterium]|nr:pantoate--beta-alanine ligase [Alphaproteobacteria bacterium]